MIYRTLEEQTRIDWIRKRRLRWLYKWRHGLTRKCEPAGRDRAKLRRICSPTLNSLVEYKVRQMQGVLDQMIADTLLYGASDIAHSGLRDLADRATLPGLKPGQSRPE